MSFRLLRFPFLVLKIIVMQMGLIEIFPLSTVSKNTKKVLTSCLNLQNIELFYYPNRSFYLTRHIDHHFGTKRTIELTLTMVDKAKQKLVYPYELWKLFGQDSVPARVVRRTYRPPVILTYWDNKSEAMDRMLEFIKGLFPKLRLKMDICLDNLELFQNTMRLIRTLKADLEYVKIHSESRPRMVHDESVKLALEECRDVKNLMISCRISPGLVLETTQRFNFDRIFLSSAEFVTKDSLMNLFFTCKNVNLTGKHFEDQDLTEIFERWITSGSKIEFLGLTGLYNYYTRKTVVNIVGQLPGAVMIQKARVQLSCDASMRITRFKDECCYLIQQNNGPKALVFKIWDAICLAVKFDVGDEVDRAQIQAEDWEDDDGEDGEEEEVLNNENVLVEDDSDGSTDQDYVSEDEEGEDHGNTSEEDLQVQMGESDEESDEDDYDNLMFF